jgi:hypothetical protein
MDFSSFDAILFPADGRSPHIVKLMTTPASYADPYSTGSSDARVPHPEIHMDFIAENVPGAWQYQVCFGSSRTLRQPLNVPQYVQALDGMRNSFPQPYIIYFPVISRDGMPFPANKTLRDIQGAWFKPEHAWRGNIVVAKYRDQHCKTMMNITMADFAIVSLESFWLRRKFLKLAQTQVKNYLSTHGSPSTRASNLGSVSSPSSSSASYAASSSSTTQPASPSSISSPPQSYFFVQDPRSSSARK